MANGDPASRLPGWLWRYAAMISIGVAAGGGAGTVIGQQHTDADHKGLSKEQSVEVAEIVERANQELERKIDSLSSRIESNRTERREDVGKLEGKIDRILEKLSIPPRGGP